jgi:hypothetical protein
MAEEHLKTLETAREQLVKQRRGLADALAKPYSRGESETWLNSFVQLQAAIDAIDRAIGDEKESVSPTIGRPGP